jgi:hypothetical protein
MKPLFFIIKKSIKNGLIELKRKPGKLVVYILFLAFLTITIISSGKSTTAKSVLNTDIYGNIVTGIMLLFTVPDIMASINNGGTFFRGADINLVFTSPVKPQNVLVYGFVKQMGNVFMSLFFLLFQAPNLLRFSNVKAYGIAIIVSGIFLMLLMNSVFKILIYSAASKSERSRAFIKNIFKSLGVIFVLIYFFNLYMIKSPGKAITVMLNSKVIKYIPIYGWIREILMTAISGISSTTYIYFILIVLSIGICVYVLYSMKLDYYEDVISSAETREEAIAATRRGERVNVKNGMKTLTRKVEYVKKGREASAIFYRHIHEYRKTGFGFINIASLIYAVLAISIGMFMPIKDLRVVLGFTIYLMFIFTFTSKWQQELTKPYIYLIPDTAFRKVIYSTVIDNIKNLVDGSILFVITGIIFKSSLMSIVFNILAYVSIGALFVYGGILARRIVGNTNSIVLSAFLRMGLLLIVVAPGLIIFAVLSTISSNVFGEYISYLVLIGYNLIASSLIIILARGIFENIELGQ